MANLVLLLTDDSEDADILRSVLAAAKDGPFAIEWVRRLADALERVRTGGIDIIFADLFLPDSQGIETFDKLFSAARYVPIMTLSPADSEHLAIEAVQRGAQGYISKGNYQNGLLPQAVRNIIQRKLVEETLFVEKERAQVTLNSIADAVISTDMAGRVTYLNAAAERMTGWSRVEASCFPISHVLNLIDRATLETAPSHVASVIHEDKPMGLNPNTVLIRRDGYEIAIEDSLAPIHDRNGRITGTVMVFHDASAAQAMAAKISHLAQHDYLTGLPNRMLLNDRISQAIALAKRTGTQLAVLFLDLDRFKDINDSFGHTVGDKLLQSVAECLKLSTRGSDAVSRQGGDEFVILMSGDMQVEDALLTAEKVLTALAQPHVISQHELEITASIGISIYPADGQDSDTLVRNADTAMYHAKKKGRNNYQFFNNEMTIRALERQSIEAHLTRALELREFVLHYQPKVNLETGAITGAEALIRWRHPERGLIPPEQFVPIAEECGLIVPIGPWVLREACMQAKIWMDSGLKPISIAVNVSALEFRSRDYLTGVRDILKETGLEPFYLELELTESVLMRNVESSNVVLAALKDMGVRLAIDDFGTGYSSLSYLQQFPIDVLKIDQSFVRDATAVSGHGIIVSAVIGMGTSLHYRVIAEGIETPEQLAFLSAEHCEEGQGFYFAKPLAAEQFARLLETGISDSLFNLSLRGA